MAGTNYIRFSYPSGAAAYGLYALVYKPDFSQIYNYSTGLFETISGPSYASYAIALSEFATLAGDNWFYSPTLGAMDDAVAYPFLVCAYPSSGTATSGDLSVGNGVVGPDVISASAVVSITPLTATVSAGEVSSNDLVAYQYAGSTYVIAITDSTGAAVSLSGKTVKFCMYRVSAPTTAVYTITGTVGGTSSNQVTVILSGATHTASSDLYQWRLWNTTDDKVIATGSLDVKANPNTT